jgi:ribonuclease HII
MIRNLARAAIQGKAMYDYEMKLAAGRGFTAYCGTDEAGRGPLAGPVYAAAVHLGGARFEGLNDSKKLSPKKRDILFDQICEETRYAVAYSSVEEIERLNILGASQLAMQRAVRELCEKTGSDVVLVDGNIARGFHIPAICVVGGDAKCASIAAASILAKVTRDREMEKLDRIYPGYGFSKHKGYPTEEHYEAIRRLGPSPVHRMSFLKKLFSEPQSDQTSRSRGIQGEELALESLLKAKYTLVERNFRSRAGEIDLIVKKDGFVVFVEVKLRKNRLFADAAEFVDLRKIDRIKKTAEYWMMKNKCVPAAAGLQPRFDVVEIYSEDDSMTDAEINHIIGAF